jgi:hypothetical protein
MAIMPGMKSQLTLGRCITLTLALSLEGRGDTVTFNDASLLNNAKNRSQGKVSQAKPIGAGRALPTQRSS